MVKRIRPKFTGTTKTCTKCGEFKPFAEFYKDKSNHAGLTTRCIKCMTAASFAARRTPEGKVISQTRWRDWRTNNPDKFRNQWLKKYGLTHETYDALLASQNGRCAICETDEPRGTGAGGKRFHVDHCHSGGGVRGLLCGHCNAGLGQFKDSIPRMQRAIEYLTQRSR